MTIRPTAADLAEWRAGGLIPADGGPAPKPKRKAPQVPTAARLRVTEKKFSGQVIKLARLHGWKVAHFRPARVVRGGVEKYETPVAADGKGWPDLVLVKGEHLLFVELKVGKNTPSESQYAWLHALGGAGVWATVWRPEMWPEIEAVLGQE